MPSSLPLSRWDVSCHSCRRHRCRPHVGTVATAPTSAASRHALLIYHAALDDLDTPAVDIAFLRGVFETERQADVDRANPVAYAAVTGTPYHDFSDED